MKNGEQGSLSFFEQPSQFTPKIELVSQYTAAYYEYERLDFSVSGTVVTANGQTVTLNHQSVMERHYQEDVSAMTVSTRPFCDPLAINFNGQGLQLTEERFDFDLTNDGNLNAINFLQAGSGYLALDSNGDGSVNQGSELFGTRSGNGFDELSVYDSDSNGWIDENDTVYNELSLWTLASDGSKALISLKQANVGAISLQHIATPYRITDSSNQSLAYVQSSGVALTEEGQSLAVKQIDLSI